MAQTVGIEGIIVPSGDPELKGLDRRWKSPKELVDVRNHIQTKTSLYPHFQLCLMLINNASLPTVLSLLNSLSLFHTPSPPSSFPSVFCCPFQPVSAMVMQACARC